MKLISSGNVTVLAGFNEIWKRFFLVFIKKNFMAICLRNKCVILVCHLGGARSEPLGIYRLMNIHALRIAPKLITMTF